MSALKKRSLEVEGTQHKNSHPKPNHSAATHSQPKPVEFNGDQALDLSVKKPPSKTVPKPDSFSTPLAVNASNLFSVSQWFSSTKSGSPFSRSSNVNEKSYSNRPSVSPVASHSPAHQTFEGSSPGVHNSRISADVSPCSSMNLSQDLK